MNQILKANWSLNDFNLSSFLCVQCSRLIIRLFLRNKHMKIVIWTAFRIRLKSGSNDVIKCVWANEQTKSTFGRMNARTATLRLINTTFLNKRCKDRFRRTIYLILTFWCHLCSTTRYHWDDFNSIFDFESTIAINIWNSIENKWLKCLLSTK